MIIGKYNFPDECPKNCSFIDDVNIFGQNSICIRCPIFNCTGDTKLLQTNEYRLDWAEEWNEFFVKGKIPKLKLSL